jgi:TIR domain
MNDIFLSYDSSDRAIAQQFSNALEALGWLVWWDREIPHGQDFDLVIEQELNAARCAIVLWSKESVQSRWVRSEAAAAAARGCLIPILIEPVTLPLEFRQIQTAALIGWNGDAGDPEFVRLLDSLTKLIGRKPEGIRSLPVRIAAPASRRRIVMGVMVAAAIVAIVIAFALRSERTVTDEQTRTPPTSVPAASVSTASVPTEEHVPVGGADALAIAIGDKIQQGAPGTGAGVIETAHEKDVYTFTAQRGQNVYFRVLNYSPALASIEWTLIDANETEIFRACLGCTQPGVQNLRAGGRYTLIVGSDRDPGVGTYRLQLHDVPDPDRFKIAIGDVIAEDATGPGAGVIESPGVEDVYSFEASPRQRVYFRVREHSSAIAYARMRLLDSDETQVFESCLGCSEPGVQVLTKGGSYTLTVGIRTDPATGTYRLQLFDVPRPDELTITIPAKIANGIPGRGAGLIESPGAEDRYTLHVDAGQKLEFKLGDYDKTLAYNQWRLVAEDGSELFNRCLGCSPPEPQILSRAGRYFLVVGNLREPSTGTYAIEIVPR